jgi:hypothetical protein
VGIAEETAGSIRKVNPGYPTSGRTQNCVNCAIATDATLSGNPATALPTLRLLIVVCPPLSISATERDAALSIRKALRDAGYSTSLNDARITLTGYADPTVAQQQIELWTASAMLANAQAKVELMGKPKGKSNAKAKKVS